MSLIEVSFQGLFWMRECFSLFSETLVNRIFKVMSEGMRTIWNPVSHIKMAVKHIKMAVKHTKL